MYAFDSARHKTEKINLQIPNTVKLHRSNKNREIKKAKLSVKLNAKSAENYQPKNRKFALFSQIEKSTYFFTICYIYKRYGNGTWVWVNTASFHQKIAGAFRYVARNYEHNVGCLKNYKRIREFLLCFLCFSTVYTDIAYCVRMAFNKFELN